MRTLMLIVAAATLALAGAAHAKCKKSPSNPLAELDLEAREKATTPSAVDAAVLAGAISKRNAEALTVDKAFAWNKRIVAVHSRCDANACGGGVSVIEGDAAKAKVVKRGLLPFDQDAWRAGDGFTVDQAAIADFDHDGQDELLVSYSVTGEPEPAVGSRGWGYLALWTLPKLKLQWVEEVGKGGEASVHEACEYVLTWKDVNCDKRTDIVLQRTCGEQHCFDNEDDPECGPDNRPRSKTHTWLHDRALDAYVPKGGSAPVTPVADDKPFLVIAASFPDQGSSAGAKAAKRVAKLQAQGFPDAAIHDSRDFARLACCYTTVTAGRFATKEEAQARVKALQAKQLKGYVRKGF